ncbi:hypothetical protein U8M76_27665, partial [Klebsiella pneumoniae]|nr:hypothetical protein [Klebsiella pneumoniae]
MTNFYCEALTALRSAPHHYLKEVGNQWRTPDLLFWGINGMYGPLMLDMPRRSSAPTQTCWRKT